MAAEQAGVFTRQQALDEGWTQRQVHLLTGRGDWPRAGGIALTTASAAVATRAVARPSAGAGPGPRSGERTWAATPVLDAEALAWSVALTWPWAVVSHRTAAQLHGFPVPGDEIGHATSPRSSRRAHRLQLHEASLLDREVTTLGGLVLTSPARTAVDCLATLPLDDAFDLWAWVSTRRVLTRGQLAEATRQRLGRRGTRQLVRLLELTRTGAASRAERRLHGLLRTAGIRGWRAGVEVRDGTGVIAVVDLLFARERVVVEVDGWRAHSGRAAFVRDLRRQNRLEDAGYRVLRVSWDDLVERPDEVVTRITRVLLARRPA